MPEDVLIPVGESKLHMRAHILNVEFVKDPLIPIVEVFCYYEGMTFFSRRGNGAYGLHTSEAAGQLAVNIHRQKIHDDQERRRVMGCTIMW